MEAGRVEVWRRPRFSICLRETDVDTFMAQGATCEWRGAGRERCCDCDATVLVLIRNRCIGLVRPLLWICTRCAKLREVEAGGSDDWARGPVHPIYRAWRDDEGDSRRAV